MAGTDPGAGDRRPGVGQGGTDDDLANEETMPASPGDLLAHHALTIHRADGNSSPTRTRRAFGFIFYSIHAKIDEAAARAYRKAAAAQRAGRI